MFKYLWKCQFPHTCIVVCDLTVKLPRFSVWSCDCFPGSFCDWISCWSLSSFSSVKRLTLNYLHGSMTSTCEAIGEVWGWVHTVPDSEMERCRNWSDTVWTGTSVPLHFRSCIFYRWSKVVQLRSKNCSKSNIPSVDRSPIRYTFCFTIRYSMTLTWTFGIAAEVFSSFKYNFPILS